MPGLYDLRVLLQESDADAEPAPVQENLGSDHKSDKFNVVSVMAYLLGVPERIFDNPHEAPQRSIFNELNVQKPARIIRNLCRLRNVLQQRYMTITNQMVRENKGLSSIKEVPRDVLRQLSDDGISIIKGNRHTVNEYIADINSLISDRINNCKNLFPIWLNWKYIRELFVMPDGMTEKGIKAAAELLYQNKRFYPYQCYMNWQPTDCGNILYNDRKFVTNLYEWHQDYFGDMSKLVDVSESTKGNIHSYLDSSKKTVLIVDCENSDPYKLYATLRGLNESQLGKISKIILYDDVHAASGWELLNEFITITVEHHVIERINEHKSLTDVTLTAGACKEFFQNQVDSFILVSSDSDFWALIRSLPDARFLVLMERDKSGTHIKEQLEKNSIFYCYIDDFYSAETSGMKTKAILKAMYQSLGACQININDILESALQSTRTSMSKTEREQFYNTYIKPMHLVIADDGDIHFVLKAR